MEITYDNIHLVTMYNHQLDVVLKVKNQRFDFPSKLLEKNNKYILDFKICNMTLNDEGAILKYSADFRSPSMVVDTHKVNVFGKYYMLQAKHMFKGKQSSSFILS